MNRKITRVFKVYPHNYKKTFFKDIWFGEDGKQKMLEQIAKNNPNETFIWHSEANLEQIHYAEDGSVEEITHYSFMYWTEHPSIHISLEEKMTQLKEFEKAQKEAKLKKKTAVIGSKGFSHYTLLKLTLDKYTICQIISGGAKGAETLAERYAQENGIPTLIFRPDYTKYGKGAPLIRNKDIIDAADLVIAFWDGESRGTSQAVSYTQKAGKKVDIIRTDQGNKE